MKSSDYQSDGDTSITREAPKEATKHYNLRRNARIRCHPYEVNNMLILTKKFKTLSLEDISIAKVMENYFRNMNTRVLSEPILLLLLLLLFLIHQLEKLSIY